MSEKDNQVPNALVRVGDKALAVRSATLIKRGLALAESLPRLESGLCVEPEEWTVERVLEIWSGGHTPENVTQLRGALDARDGHVRILAAESLARWREYPKEALPVLIAVLETIHDSSIRSAPHWEEWGRVAAGAIGNYGSEAAPAIPSLVTALSDRDYNVRGYAALSMGKIGSEAGSVIPRLEEALDTETIDAARCAMEEGLSEAHTSLGEELRKSNDWEGAILQFREAIRLKPDYAPAHYALGNALDEEGDLDGGIAEFRTAIHLEPDNALAHYTLGIALGRKGDLDGAIVEYLTAIRLQPDATAAHCNLGAALYKKGDLDGAIAESRTAIRLRPDAAAAHYNLGIALDDKGDLDGAIAEYRAAIRLRPGAADAHYNLGLALEMKGDRLAALDEIEKARELDPKNSSITEAHERIRRKAG